MTDLDAKIRRAVDGFVQELSSLVRQSAVEMAVNALRGTVQPPSGPPKAKAAPRKTAPAKAPPKGVNRRSPKQIEKAVQSVLAYVKSHSNIRSEDVRKALSLSQAQTQDALTRLQAKKAIKSKGERRSTTYSVV